MSNNNKIRISDRLSHFIRDTYRPLYESPHTSVLFDPEYFVRRLTSAYPNTMVVPHDLALELRYDNYKPQLTVTVTGIQSKWPTDLFDLDVDPNYTMYAFVPVSLMIIDPAHDTIGHANLLILYYPKRKVFLFEPLGRKRQILDDIRTFFHQQLPQTATRGSHWTFHSLDSSTCPIGLQIRTDVMNEFNGVCALWTLFLSYELMEHPNQTPSAIIKNLYRLNAFTLRSRMLRFLNTHWNSTLQKGLNTKTKRGNGSRYFVLFEKTFPGKRGIFHQNLRSNVINLTNINNHIVNLTKNAKNTSRPGPSGVRKIVSLSNTNNNRSKKTTQNPKRTRLT